MCKLCLQRICVVEVDYDSHTVTLNFSTEFDTDSAVALSKTPGINLVSDVKRYSCELEIGKAFDISDVQADVYHNIVNTLIDCNIPPLGYEEAELNQELQDFLEGLFKSIKDDQEGNPLEDLN